MKKVLLAAAVAMSLGAAGSASAWWGDRWGGGDGYYNDWPTWTPMYWMEEMFDTMDDNGWGGDRPWGWRRGGGYGGPGYYGAPYGGYGQPYGYPGYGAPYGYSPYGYAPQPQPMPQYSPYGYGYPGYGYGAPQQAAPQGQPGR